MHIVSMLSILMMAVSAGDAGVICPERQDGESVVNQAVVREWRVGERGLEPQCDDLRAVKWEYNGVWRKARLQAALHGLAGVLLHLMW